MSRLIDADALLEKVQFRNPIDNRNEEIISRCVTLTRRIIEASPTIDAVPVVHGRWKRYGRNLGECSECGEVIAVRYRYCPNCGAKMDGANDA